MFFLINIVVSIVLAIADVVLGTSPYIVLLYLVAVLLPSLAVGVRRLHDTGRSGWWLLISLIPLVGPIIMLVFLASDSKPHDNAYGPNPKQVPAH